MARKKVVTAEAIKEAGRQLKRIKKLQRGKILVGHRADSQPIYHWAKITKALIAKKIGVSPDYLTSLQSKDDSVKDALKYYGQPRGRLTLDTKDSPSPGTKAYLKQQNYKLVAENEKLRKRLSNCRKGNKSNAEQIELIDEILEANEKFQNEKKVHDQEKVKLTSQIKSLKMQVASLSSRLALKDGD